MATGMHRRRHIVATWKAPMTLAAELARLWQAMIAVFGSLFGVPRRHLVPCSVRR